MTTLLLRSLLFACVWPFVALLTGCATIPETGRRQLLLVSDDTAAAQGINAFQGIKEQEAISRDPQHNARIQRIGRRIAAAVGRDLPNAEWEFVVFESKELNAFALPGGKVGVYTGLINLAGPSDDEIAVVMGHEIAHVTSRHGAERQSQAILAAAGGLALGVATRNSDNQNAYLLAYGLGSTLGTLAYSRHHETEADVIGLRFAARAGYDPRAGATFWEKMEAGSKGPKPPRWLSTHPPSSDRIANLRRLAPELMPTYEQARAAYGVGVPPALARPVYADDEELRTPAGGLIRPARKGDPVPGMAQ
jgi:metalloendopeptidase OMA1, mitochondrial